MYKQDIIFDWFSPLIVALRKFSTRINNFVITIWRKIAKLNCLYDNSDGLTPKNAIFKNQIRNPARYESYRMMFVQKWAKSIRFMRRFDVCCMIYHIWYIIYIGGKRGRRERARIRYLPVRQSKSDSKMGWVKFQFWPFEAV